MDIALELCDTFLLDRVYATAHPAPSAPYLSDSKANATGQHLTTWQYTPSTHLFTLEPSQYAYMSAWPRDNAYRQFISCFALTWYADPPAAPPPSLGACLGLTAR